MKVALNRTVITVWFVPRWLAKVVRFIADPFDGSGNAAAITFGHIVLVLLPKVNDVLLWHESVHVKQAEECEPRWVPWAGFRRFLGSCRYQWRYLIEWFRHGYAFSKYEVAAYAQGDWFASLPPSERPEIKYFTF